jgi:hypothetical protein
MGLDSTLKAALYLHERQYRLAVFVERLVVLQSRVKSL